MRAHAAKKEAEQKMGRAQGGQRQLSLGGSRQLGQLGADPNLRGPIVGRK